MGMTKGVCRNTACSTSADAVPIERYEGPGEYCPECGERLEALAPQASVPLSAAAPFHGLSALQALQQFEAGEAAPPHAPARARSRLRRPLVASGALGAVVVGSLLFLHPSAIGHTAGTASIRLCASSMTQRLAADAVRAYAEKAGSGAAQFTLSGPAACEIRLGVTLERSAAALAHDAVVAAVNPANRVVRLDEETVRRIYRGEIKDWSQAGGAPGAIVALLPREGSDEANALAAGLLRGVTIDRNVRRLQDSAEVTRALIRADSRGAIGLVAFSEAVPAKVLALGQSAVPSPITIGDLRYPLALNVTINSEGANREAAQAFSRYMQSEDAQAVVARSGLIPRKGF